MAELVCCPNCGLDYEFIPELIGQTLSCERCGYFYRVSCCLPDLVCMYTSTGIIIYSFSQVEAMINSKELARDSVCLSIDGDNWISYNDLLASLPLQVELLDIPPCQPQTPSPKAPIISPEAEAPTAPSPSMENTDPQPTAIPTEEFEQLTSETDNNIEASLTNTLTEDEIEQIEDIKDNLPDSEENPDPQPTALPPEYSEQVIPEADNNIEASLTNTLTEDEIEQIEDIENNLPDSVEKSHKKTLWKTLLLPIPIIASLLVLLLLGTSFTVLILYHANSNFKNYISEKAPVGYVLDYAERNPSGLPEHFALWVTSKALPAETVKELFQAIQDGQPNKVELLMKIGLSPNTKTPEGTTALAVAVATSSTNPSNNEIPNTTVSNSKTPEATPSESESHLAVIKILLDAGATPDLISINPGGRKTTPLNISRKLRLRGIENMLIQAGARH